MGRIDEALQRSGQTRVAAEPRGSAAADVFGSPWNFKDMRNAGSAVTDVDGDAAVIKAVGPKEVRGMGKFSIDWLERLVIAPHADPMLIEQFRQLAATLHHAQVASQLRVLMLTSAESSEGKSLTAMNLALTLSDSYNRRVLLIDADLRRPSLHEIAQVPNVSGLGETLKSTELKKVSSVEISRQLQLVPAGRPEQDPMQALSSPRMHQILKDATARYDWVLIDAPPIGGLADASVLAQLADAVLLVVRAGYTAANAVERAVQSIGHDRLVGVVLNKVDDLESVKYRRAYSNYSPDPLFKS